MRVRARSQLCYHRSMRTRRVSPHCLPAFCSASPSVPPPDALARGAAGSTTWGSTRPPRGSRAKRPDDAGHAQSARAWCSAAFSSSVSADRPIRATSPPARAVAAQRSTRPRSIAAERVELTSAWPRRSTSKSGSARPRELSSRFVSVGAPRHRGPRTGARLVGDVPRPPGADAAPARSATPTTLASSIA